ncbi:MAG: hypothetical protein MUD11_12290 [Rhodobacteraceae bacterium]|jgi:hypothetical protein|nr:hypothetical protein [Paracoccaceae bacterium]
MRIAYHLGAHCTDEERLIRCLLKNRGALGAEGIVVPPPSRYRTLLRDTAIQLKGAAATLETQALVLEQIMAEDSATRLVLGWDNFLSFPKWALHGTLYPAAGDRLRAFSQIFPDLETDYFIALRNPATFVPAILAKETGADYATMMNGADPRMLRWSEMLARIQAANPDVRLTVWCDEDTPLIWPEVIQAITGHGPETVIDGHFDVLELIMSPSGLKRLKSYLDTKGAFPTERRRRAVAAFLDKFALPEKLTVDIALPGWTEALVAELTNAYIADCARIAAMPGVTFIAP